MPPARRIPIKDSTRLETLERRVDDHDEARLETLERRVDDHDEVLVELKNHLGKLSENFDAVIGWFRDKRTRTLALVAVALVLGPEGVDVIRSTIGV